MGILLRSVAVFISMFFLGQGGAHVVAKKMVRKEVLVEKEEPGEVVGFQQGQQVRMEGDDRSISYYAAQLGVTARQAASGPLRVRVPTDSGGMVRVEGTMTNLVPRGLLRPI